MRLVTVGRFIGDGTSAEYAWLFGLGQVAGTPIDSGFHMFGSEFLAQAGVLPEIQNLAPADNGIACTENA